MKLEKQTLYKRYTSNGVSYVLILDIQKRGMQFVYLTNEKDNAYYSNIDGLYISDINSCVSINRILYCDWSKVHVKYYEMYRKLSVREMRKISMAVKDLYDGVITYDKNGHMCYSDELAENDVDDSGSECHIDDTKDSDNINVAKTTIVESSITTVKKSTVTEILKSSGISVESDTDIDGKHEYFIDLISTDGGTYKGNHTNPSTSRKAKRGKPKMHRHMYSESEALAITTMTHSEIMQKYGVSKSIAAVMKRNANKYFGFTNKYGKNGAHNGVTDLFKQGLSIDQIMEQHPEYDIRTVRSCYENYCISKLDKTSCIDDLQKLVLEGSIENMIEIDNLTFVQFCEKYNCSKHCAKTIKVTVRNILSRNIYFAVFGTEAYGDLANRMRDTDRNGVANRIDVVNYQTCTRLKDVYESTYDDHFDIITGSKPIPDCLHGDDRIRFVEIIKQRCNERIRDRVYNIDQLRLIDNRDIEGLANILVINYSKANNIINRKTTSAVV